MTPSDDDKGTADDPLFDPDFEEKISKTIREKLAPLSLEERRAWFQRWAAKLGLEPVIITREKKPEDGEPE